MRPVNQFWRESAQRRRYAYTLAQAGKGSTICNKPFYFLIAVLVGLLIIIGVTLLNPQVRQVDMQIGLHMYCIDYERSTNCTQWTQQQLQSRKAKVQACAVKRYPDNKSALYACLKTASF